VVTGNGRVAAGAIRNLTDMGITQVSTEDFLSQTFDHPVFTQVTSDKYVRRKDGQPFNKADFHQNGDLYESTFAPYYQKADIFLNCIYYDQKAPAFFTVEEMQSPDFHISVIADITCDIMPGSSVPATIRSSTIADPVYTFHPATNAECALHTPDGVDIMAIDNLPSELPRDASAFFGEQLIHNVLPELVKGRQSAAMLRGMIAENGELGPHFGYLKQYVSYV
jgi:saccharopine dehydrogenase (NAD+, L-lysine forming)